MALATVVLGTVGFARAAMAGPGGLAALGLAGWLDAFYRTLQLFVLERPEISPLPWEIELARFLAPGISVFTAVKALLVLFREQLDLVRLGRLKRHVVICGGGEKGRRLAEAFRRRGDRTVVIDRDADNPNLHLCRQRRGLVLVGDATEPDVLARARVAHARFLVSLMGDDGANAEAAAQGRELVRGGPPGGLICVVHVNDPALWRMFREKSFTTSDPEAPCRLEFFNLLETGARVLLDRHPPFGTERGSDERPCLLVVGLGRLGQCLIVRAAKDWRLCRGSAGSRPRVVVADREAAARVSLLRAHYPQIDENLEIFPWTVDVRTAEFAATDSSQGVPQPTVAYICFGDDALSISTALVLERVARARHGSFPIVVRVEEEIGLARLLPGAESGGLVTPFGLLDRTCNLDLLTGGVTETIGRALHATYVRGEQARGVDHARNVSVVHWDELPEPLQEQNRDQADFIGKQLREAGYSIVPLVDWDACSQTFPDQVVEGLAIAEHDRWVRKMRREGYRRGTKKDERRKTHPCIVDWQELPEEEKNKDRHFVREWPSVLFLAGFQVRPEAS